MREPESNPIIFVVLIVLCIVILGLFGMGKAKAEIPYEGFLKWKSEAIGNLIYAYCFSMTHAERMQFEQLVNQHTNGPKAMVVCYPGEAKTTAK